MKQSLPVQDIKEQIIDVTDSKISRKIKIVNFIKLLFGKKDVSLKHTLISSLAPKVLTKSEDIDKIQPYLDKLNETIDTNGISNIALTGGYGSGKSTVIKTFQELNSQYEYLNISLASFNKKENNDELSPSDKKLQKEELERLLEVSILQQIFYHVKPDEIPESRFKRIINIPSWKIWGISLGFILWVSSSVLLLKYDYLDKINPDGWKMEQSFDWFALFTFLIVFTGLGIFSKLIIKLFSNSKINKVNIKGELELGDNVSKSVFNEHLEEILYFFEVTKFNVVIIEDLDRFDNTDIFTKLREINILLNNSKLINREINFVYAVGDDLFDDKKERVKFFEYIIPVIPFINSANADDQLRNLIRESGLDESIFTKEFISDVTTFIDDIDMRLLTNIFHEFVIYRKTLKPEFIKKHDELFALITYKNIDPKDFTKLNRKEGKLYELISNKRSYIKKFISIIEAEIILKNSQIEDIEEHTLTDIEELKSIYFLKILSKLPHNALIDKASIESDFEKMIESKALNYNYHQRGFGTLSQSTFNFNFSEIESELNEKLNFKDRVRIIESKNNYKINLLKNEIEKLKSKKIEIENWDIKQIFNEVDINDYLNDFSNNGLLRNLILNGYINENYNDYISLFHEVSITKEDFTFERNVKGGYSTDFNYKLSNKIENLVERIDGRYFGRETILNFDLVDYLGANYDKYSDKFDSIIRLLSNEKEKSIQFIDEYVKNEDRPLRIFIEKLVENWKEFWEYIYAKSNYTEDRENKYLELIIRFTKNETILNNQNTNSLRTAIEEKANFISLIKDKDGLDYFNKVSKLLKELNIKFEKIENPEEETSKLFEYIYNNNHYKINIDNLSQMFLIFGKESLEEEFKISNYSTILKSDCKPLIDYIHANIATYVEDVFLKLEENKLESESGLIKLLNNENLSSKLKVKIIQKVETIISDLKNVNETEIKTQLLINNLVLPSWKNVINYYAESKNTINESLIQYLEFEDINLELSAVKLLKEDEVFEESILLCNEISDEAYINYLSSCYFTYNKLNFEELNEDKVVALANKILNTTKSNFDLLKEHFPNNHIKLIERDYKEFIKNIDDFEMNDDDVLLLLKSEKISIENKFNYLSQIEERVIVNNKEISKVVGNIILAKSTKKEYEYETVASLVQNVASLENKVRLVNLYINDLSNNNIVTLLSTIWGYDKLFEKGKPTYGKTIYNNILFTNLKSKNLIKNYYDDKWNDSNFRITTNY